MCPLQVFPLGGYGAFAFGFLLTILEEYRLRCSQLPPQVVLLLSIFAHLCDGFISITSLVAFFRHFYYLRSSEDKSLGCGMTLRLRSGLKDFLEGTFKSHWDEWRHQWCYVVVDRVLQYFSDPTALAVPQDS
jgi:hypothetical protein